MTTPEDVVIAVLRRGNSFAEELFRSFAPVASTCRPVEHEEVRREVRAIVVGQLIAIRWSVQKRWARERHALRLLLREGGLPSSEGIALTKAHNIKLKLVRL